MFLFFSWHLHGAIKEISGDADRSCILKRDIMCDFFFCFFCIKMSKNNFTVVIYVVESCICVILNGSNNVQTQRNPHIYSKSGFFLCGVTEYNYYKTLEHYLMLKICAWITSGRFSYATVVAGSAWPPTCASLTTESFVFVHAVFRFILFFLHSPLCNVAFIKG